MLESQSSPMSFGSASETRKPSGLAPLAARSDRFTRSAFCATALAGSSGKKWMPETMASVLSTISVPGGGLMKAASSVSPSAPGWVAMGPKYRAISLSSLEGESADMGRTLPHDLSGRELLAAQLAGELIEHGVDHAGLVALDEGGGNIGIFGNDGTSWHVAAVRPLIGAGAQGGAQHRLDALERPALLQRFVDLRVKHALLAHHTGDDVPKERRFRRQILRALDLAAEPVAFELGENVVEAGAGHVHLIQRLHRGEPRCAEIVRFARVHVGDAGAL